MPLETVALGSVPGGVVAIERLQASVVTRLEPLSGGDMFARLEQLASGVIVDDCVDPRDVAKAQVCGPFTAARFGCRAEVGAAVATLAEHHPRLTEVWLDEPMLGTPTDAERVADTITALRARFEHLRWGVHCCAPVDPAVLAGTGADILHIDAAVAGEATADWLRTALRRTNPPSAGRSALPEVVWGIVPTGDLPAADVLHATLGRLLVRAGLPKERWPAVRIAPACGLGTLSIAHAGQVMSRLRSVSAMGG